MNENDIIAEYIKSKYPELLYTTDFALYKLGKGIKDFVNRFKENLKKINFSNITINNSEYDKGYKEGYADGSLSVTEEILKKNGSMYVEIYNMVQTLGKAGRYDLVNWFGDYAIFEKLDGITDEQIIEAYREMEVKDE